MSRFTAKCVAIKTKSSPDGRLARESRRPSGTGGECLDRPSTTGVWVVLSVTMAGCPPKVRGQGSGGRVRRRTSFEVVVYGDLRATVEDFATRLIRSLDDVQGVLICP